MPVSVEQVVSEMKQGMTEWSNIQAVVQGKSIDISDGQLAEYATLFTSLPEGLRQAEIQAFLSEQFVMSQ